VSDDRKEQSRKYFDKDAASYDLSRMYAQNRFRYRYVVEEALLHRFSNYLDIGCGTGALLSLIAQHRDGARLYGLDLSEQMLKVAHDRLGQSAELVLGDSERLPFEDAKFDLITCTFSFHHYPNPESVMAEIGRVLTIHGKLIIADPWIGAPLRQILNLLLPLNKKGDIRIYSRREMCDITESAGLQVVKWTTTGWHGFLMVSEKVW
jgi:ubiquinone/menaquinone biosynthesis C-methylase UbiE